MASGQSNLARAIAAILRVVQIKKVMTASERGHLALLNFILSTFKIIFFFFLFECKAINLNQF